MSKSMRVKQLNDELWAAIDHCKAENAYTWAEIIGALEIIKLDLYNECAGEEDVDDSIEEDGLWGDDSDGFS